MKGATPLDYVEFQLTPRRTRCEVFVSAEGATEKLASGSLKPFVTHLRAAEVQVARGSQKFRLDGHGNFKKQIDNRWFTKGTLERFVRFVSTPEVIEGVKVIEDELDQLEQVRTALVKTFAQNEERFPRIDTAFSTSGKHSDQDAISVTPRRSSIDAGDNAADTSKKELLRAMEGRLIALQQEQDLAFSCAAAAGFGSSNMADLITFAKTFGADRLNDACLQFIALLKKRKLSAGVYEEIDSPSAEAASTGSDMSLESCEETDMAMEPKETSDFKSRNSESWLDGPKITGFETKVRAEEWGVNMKARANLSSCIDNNGTQTRSNTGTRRRWGPPEKLQMDYSYSQINSSQNSPESKMDQEDTKLREHGVGSSQAEGQLNPPKTEIHFPSSQQEQTAIPGLNRNLTPNHSPGDRSSNPVSKGSMFFTRLQQMAQRVEARRCEDPGGRMHGVMIGMDNLSQGSSKVAAFNLSSSVSISSDKSQPSMVLGDQGQAQSHNMEVETVPSSTPLIERSSSLPAQVLQLEHSQLVNPSSGATQNVNHSLLQSEVVKEKDCLKKPEANVVVGGEDKNAKGNKAEPVKTSGRRLSVQAAISLFESKKADPVEPPSRKIVKQGSGRGSVESSSPSTPEKAILRRWNGTNFPTSDESCVQEKGAMLDSTEPRTNSEVNLTKHKDEAQKDTSVRSKVMQNIHSHLTDEKSVTERFRRLNFQQPEQIGPLTSSPVLPATRQHSLGNTSPNVRGEDIEKQFKLDLAKSLARVARNNAAKEIVITSRSEGESTKTTIKPTKDLYNELTNEDQSIGNSQKPQKEAEIKRSGQSTGHFLPKLSNINGPKLAHAATQEHEQNEKVAISYSQQELAPSIISENLKEKTDDDATQNTGLFLTNLRNINGPKPAPLATKNHDNDEQEAISYLQQGSIPSKISGNFKERTDDDVTQSTDRFVPKLSNISEPKPASLATQDHGNNEQVATTYTKQELASLKISEKIKERTDDDVAQSTGHFLPKLSNIKRPKPASLATRIHSNDEQVATADSEQELVSSKLSGKFKERTEDDVTQSTGHFLPKLNNINKPKQAPLATQDLENNDEAATAYLKQESVPSMIFEKLKERADDHILSATRISSGWPSSQRERNARKEVSTSFWNSPLDFHMDALVKIVDNHNRDILSHEDFTHGGRERFHEYFDKLRDARRRWEHPAKRAEREAKLKFMQEIYEIRIAEMEERLLRPQKNDTHHAQVNLSITKLHPQRADLLVSQMEQDELLDLERTKQEYNTFPMQDLSYESSDSASASAPHLAKNQASALKSHISKKPALNLSKSLTGPRPCLRTAVLPSPRSSQKNMLGTSSQRKSLSPNHNGSIDNSKPVPNSTDLMKETAKPSSARALASAKVNLKVHGHSRTASDGSLMADDIALANDDVLSGSADKEELKQRLSLIKKTLTSASELKALSAQAFDPTVLVSPKGQQEQFTDSVVFGKAKRDPMALAQEIKPFLRKGRGIGPGAGPGVMKQKLSVPVDASKFFDEDGATESLLNGETTHAYIRQSFLEPRDLTKSVAPDGFEDSSESENLGTARDPLVHESNGYRSLYVGEGLPADWKLRASSYLPVEPSSGDIESSSVLFPAEDPILVTQNLFHEESNFGQETTILSAPISELLAWKNMDISQSNASFVTSSVPFWEVTPSQEDSASPFHPAAFASASLSVTQYSSVSDHLSPPSGMALDSPLGSPLSWNSTQTHFPSETEVVRSHRPSSGPQKSGSNAAQMLKEPAKGFKRLLHFGWKTRASETATSDYASASTTFEGDDDTEEARDLGSQSSDESFLRARMQDRVFECARNGNHYNFPDQGTSQKHRSSIPAPPISFKLREDNSSGVSLLKAPRSFFSLSSFRSRGGEGKSR